VSDPGPVLAALDFGTGGGKCMLVDAEGRCLAVVREPWGYREEPVDPPGFTRGYAFDPDAFWAALARCTRTALASAGLRPESIVGVAATAQRLGSVFLDARGREIYAGPNMDGRGFDGAMRIMGTLGLERAVAIGGHWPPFVSTLARLLVHRARPDATPVATILTLSDWISWRLTGEATSEPSNACETMLLDFPTRRWSREVLEAFEVDPRLLPPIVEPSSPIGRVTAEAARATGLREGTPVFAGGGDTQCALLGSDVVAPGRAGAVLGTTTPVMSVDALPRIDPAGRLWSGCHVLPGRFTIESNSGDTGIAWEWLLDLLGLRDDAAFAAAEAEIALLPDEPQPAFGVVGPQVFDLMAFNPHQAFGFLLRMPPFTPRPGRATLLRAFQENVVFAVRANLEQIETLQGAPVESLTISGGMTRSPGLLAGFARVLHRPLLVSEEPNATALGAAILAAAGAGVQPSIAAAADAMVRLRPLATDEGTRDAWEAQYARWRELYDQMRATTL
jgi:autoinducer 2 (AI-2) kinase